MAYIGSTALVLGGGGDRIGLTGESLDHGQNRGRQWHCLLLFIAVMALSGSVLVAFGAVNVCFTPKTCRSAKLALNGRK